MTLNELNKLIGDKRESCPWSSGEMANLVMIGSNIMVTLSLGATRKDSYQFEISEGDSVLVTGHGDYWTHKATLSKLIRKKKLLQFNGMIGIGNKNQFQSPQLLVRLTWT